MSDHNTPHAAESASTDPVETIVSVVPVVLPLVGGIMIFLLAFIAVTMA